MLKKISKIILIIILILILIVCFLLYRGNKFYDSIFRLTPEQVRNSLDINESECKKLSECELQPGDILIRRYVTPVTEIAYITLDPYFTHSAVYLGNDELFEALGNYETPENQVMVTKLSESDWFYEDMRHFVIVRPKSTEEKIENFISKLRAIADDNEYVFGPLKDGRKTVTCSDIILKYIEEDGLVSKKAENPKYISPDYLFWITKNNEADFEINKYNIE